MQHIKPIKSLGQNFLIDKNISRKIIASLDCQDRDNIFEIGPGTGSLTEILINEPINLTSIEIDKRAVEELNEKFKLHNQSNFKLIHQDFLDFDIYNYIKQNEIKQKIKFIGNIPYNISSQILFKLFDNSYLISKSILMLQKEVAQRIVSNLGTKQYGILSVATKLVGDPKILFDVSPNCFFPKPKVVSSILEINFDANQSNNSEFYSILKFVKAAFNQRRKVLRNSLKSIIEDKTKHSIDDFIEYAKENHFDVFTKRAEELAVEDYIRLKELVESKIF